MSDLFDNLARQLAEPMPRRRAVRIMVAAGAATLLPAIRPRAAVAIGPCSPGEAGFECDCPSKNGLFFKECCPEHFYKCVCAPDAAICELTCPDERQCGTVCCEEGGSCARASKNMCCKRGEDVCEGRHGVTCCDAEHACCEGKCCPRKDQFCNYKGQCERCPKGHERCGDETCCFPPTHCCGTTCCQKDEACAFSGGLKGCCPPDQVTHANGHAFCCPYGTVPRHGTCCPKSGSCECDGLSCLPGTYCSGGTCVRI
jgi:hypothetical protein